MTCLVTTTVNVAICMVIVEGMEKVLPSPNCGNNEEVLLTIGRKGTCVCIEGWKRVVSETGEKHCRKTCSLSKMECPKGTACSKGERNEYACVCAENFTLSSSGECLANPRGSVAKPSNLAWIGGVVVGAIGVVMLVIVGLVLIIRYRRKKEDIAFPVTNQQGDNLKQMTSDNASNAEENAQRQSETDGISRVLSLHVHHEYGVADSEHVITHDVTASSGMTGDTPGERLSDLYSNGKIVKNRKPVQS